MFEMRDSLITLRVWEEYVDCVNLEDVYGQNIFCLSVHVIFDILYSAHTILGYGVEVVGELLKAV